MIGRMILTTRSTTGRCRRPVPGALRGHLVVRVGRDVDDAAQLVDDDEEPDPWRVGDQVDVHPLREPDTRCRRCWACRGRALVDAVRRLVDR